jgi:hypothetical protein
MADLPISNRYKAYKEGTDSLVRWVTRKASIYSNAAEYLCTLAKPDRRAITLTTRDLVTLTNLVVANGAVEIPENILNITQDVAAERQVCANWYKDNNKHGELTASDKTHAYFIDILHEIYDILHSARASQKQDNPRPSQQTSSESIPSAFNNSFQHLKVEEPVENPLGTTTGTVEGFTAADKLTFPLEKQKSDKAFAIWCLLGDFDDVRVYIIRVWKDYKAGRKSLLATGAITDTAFGLMRHANEDFANDNSNVANYQAMLAFLEEEMLVAMDGETMQDESTNSGTMKDEDTRKTTSHRSRFTGRDLDTILCRKSGKFFEILSKAFQTNAGTAIPALSPCNSVYESPLGAFGDTLLKLAWTITNLALDDIALHPTEGKHYRISRDEFLSAPMNHALKGEFSQAPIWLVAAGQCYKEIHDVLGDALSCGAEDLLTYLHRVRPRAKRAEGVQMMRQNLVSKEVKAIADRPSARQECFNLLGTEVLTNTFDATMHLAQIAEFDDWNFNFLASTAALAQVLPLYPCYFNFRLRHGMQFFTLPFLGVHIVLAIATLYRAGEELGLIKSAWKDMDFVLANHVSFKIGRTGTKSIVSKPSRRVDPFEMVALFRAALGVPAVDLDKAVRPRLPDISTTSSYHVTFQSHLLKAMYDTEAEVLHLEVSDREHVNIMLQKLSDLEKKKTSKKKGRTKTKYTLAELVETYDKHFEAVEPILTFDYINFIDLCALHCHDLNGKYLIGRVYAPMPEIWDFVDCLLWTAADVVRKSQHQSPEELHQTLLKTKLGRAVTDLEEIIKFTGDVCSNGLP